MTNPQDFPAPATRGRVAVLAAFAMLAFAGNSLLCRLALGHTAIDAASFTTIRLASGALVLWWLLAARRRDARIDAKTDARVDSDSLAMSAGSGASWWSACALFVYAAGFSLAYTRLPAATGALLLFGTVQATMIGVGLWRGERLAPWQLLGLCSALAGLVALLLPGLAAPPLDSALLMAAAGVAWGVYSLRGKRAIDPLETTAGNFLRAVPFALLASTVAIGSTTLDGRGVGYAIASGALTSGVGYAIWYAVLPRLAAMQASVLQLSVPVIAAAGGLVLLGEAVTLRFVLCSVAILGGVLLVITRGRRRA